MDLPTLVRLFEANEIAAWRTLYQSPPGEVASQLGMGFLEHAGALLMWNRGAPVPILNRLVGLGVFTPADEPTVDFFLERSRAERCPCLVQVAPTAQPDELESLLVARGLRRIDRWQVQHGVLKAQTEPATLAGYRIERVTAANAAAWAETILSGWQFPPHAAVGLLALVVGVVNQPGWHCYAAFEQQRGAIVGASTMYIADGVAGLYFDTVRGEHRQHGLQLAMLQARLSDAQRLGCANAFAPTPIGGSPERNMARAGLDQAYERPNYVSDRAAR